MGSIDALSDAMKIRVQHFGETTSDATVATAITILRSLKAATPKAPLRVGKDMFSIKQTNLYGGYARKGGSFKVVARTGSHHGSVSSIRPAMGFDAHNVDAVMHARVYEIHTANPYDTFTKNINAPSQCWYVLCEHQGQAEAYANSHILRILQKESGMAKYTLSIAQAKASNRCQIMPSEQAATKGMMSPRAASIAYDASHLDITSRGWSSGSVEVFFKDLLNYSAPAAGGDRAVSNAIEKASKSMVAYVEKMSGKYFDDFRTKHARLYEPFVE